MFLLQENCEKLTGSSLHYKDTQRHRAAHNWNSKIDWLIVPMIYVNAWKVRLNRCFFKQIRKTHHNYKVVRYIRAWFVPSLSPSSLNQLRIKGLTFFISEQWRMKTRTQKLLKPVSQGQPLCLEILTLMFSILARYQRMYNFTSMPKWRTVHKHTRRLRMQMQTWVYRKKLWKRWENYWALAVVHSRCWRASAS